MAVIPRSDSISSLGSDYLSADDEALPEKEQLSLQQLMKVIHEVSMRVVTLVEEKLDPTTLPQLSDPLGIKKAKGIEELVPHNVALANLVERVAAIVQRTLQERGHGPYLDRFPEDRVGEWLRQESIELVANLHESLESLDHDYFHRLIHEDERRDHHQESIRRRRALLEELHQLPADEFVERFNQAEDQREVYRIEWYSRYKRLLNYCYHRHGQIDCRRVSTARDGLFTLAKCGDPEMVRRAVLSLIDLLEGADPRHPDAAHHLELLERGLREWLTPENIEALTTEEQRLIIRAYATTIESILIHYSLGHQNAIGQSTKDEIWDRAKGLEEFNTINDPTIRFYVFYAVQGAQRLRTNEGQLMGILKRLKHVFNAAVLIVDLAANREDVGEKLMGAFQSLQQAFYHWENHEAYYDSLLMLKKLLRISESDLSLFRKIKWVVQSNKSQAVDPSDEQVSLLFGTMEYIAYSVGSTQNSSIKEEGLKLILQYASVNHPEIQKKVVDVLAGMMRDGRDPRLSSTARALLELMQAGQMVESEAAVTYLEEVVEEAAERHTIPQAPRYENVLKFLLRRMAEVKDEGYPGISLLNLLAYSKQEQSSEVVRCLVRKLGCDIKEPDLHGNSPYHIATLHHNRELITELAGLDEGRETINRTNQEGRTPLHLCAISGYADVMQELISQGADIHAVSDREETALGLAIEHGNMEMVDLLISQGGRVSERHREVTPLFHAAYVGQEKVLRHLLDHTAEITPMEAVGIQAYITGQDDTLHCSQEFADYHVNRLEADAAYRHQFEMFLLALERDEESQLVQLVRRNVNMPPLMNAVKEGNIANVRAMLKEGKDMELIHQMGDTLGDALLHYAVSHPGETGCTLTRLLIGGGANVNAANRLGMTPLHLAASIGRADLVEILLEPGPDLGSQCRAGYTPLHIAAAAHQKEIVDLLLSKGADPNARNGNGFTTLHMAVGNPVPVGAPAHELTKGAYGRMKPDGSQLEVVEQLLAAGADPAAEDENRNNVLHHAARFGCGDVVAHLVHEFPSLFWMKNSAGNIPMEEAFGAGSEMACLAMLDHSAGDLEGLIHQYEESSERGATLAGMAAASGQSHLLHTLMKAERECSPGKRCKAEGRYPLHLGCLYGHVEVVRVCLEAGASVVESDRFDQTPLHLAVMRPASRQILDDLVEAGADLNSPNSHGATPLHVACSHGSLEAVEYLVEHGAEIVLPDGDGNTPLHMAARNGHDIVVRFLCEEIGDEARRTAAVNHANDDGKTPLHSAASQDHLQAARVLLSLGAEVRVEDFYGMRPIHYSAQNGNLAMTRTFLAEDAYWKARDDEGETPLHKAAFHFRYEVASLLLELDARRPRGGEIINAQDIRLETPLHEVEKQSRLHSRVALAEKLKMIRLLVARGADLNAADEFGLTVLHRAAQNDDVEEIRYLLALSRVLPKGRRIELDAKDRWKNRPLHHAAERGNVNTIRTLLEVGAKIDARNERQETPLLVAVRHNQREVVQTLLEVGAARNKPNEEKHTLLHVAIDQPKPSLRMINMLLETAPELLQECDSEGNTPLHTAARRGHLRVAKLLIRELHGMDENKRRVYYEKRNKAGHTAVGLARESGHLEVAEKLDSIPRSELGLKRRR